MKTYRIKSQFSSVLKGLNGLYITPTESSLYVNINVFDNRAYNLYAPHRLTSLPESSNKKLVYDFLKQMQLNKITPEEVDVLREYLQCAEKKDKNNEIKSDIKAAFKEIFFGLLFIAGGGVGGLALMVVLMGMFPGVASWISLLIIPVVAAAAYGVINAVIGCLKLGIGIFSFCFRQKNADQLPVVENKLNNLLFQANQPPAYQEIIKNNTKFTEPALYSELPTYQQAIKNIAAPSVRTATPPINIPTLVTLPSHSSHFFHHHLHHSVSNRSVVNNTPPPVYSYVHY